MTVPFEDQGVYVSSERWTSLRGEPAFVELVRLARVANSLTLAYPPVLHTLQDQSPRARRERFAAMFYAAALLHEGMQTAEGLGQFLRHLPQYRSGFVPLFADPAVKSFRNTTLDRVRDKLVFHFDRASLAKGLTYFPDGEQLVLSTTDFTEGSIYFDIADDALLGYLFGDAPTEQDYHRRIGRFIEQTTDLFTRFMQATHSLIPAALLTMDCYTKSMLRPGPIADDAG